MLPCAMRVWKLPETVPNNVNAHLANNPAANVVAPLNDDKACFMEGSLVVTVKRDILGMPLLHLGHFMPSMTMDYQYRYFYEQL
jgi:hypothetical protein